jgi:hypothetical protein
MRPKQCYIALYRENRIPMLFKTRYTSGSFSV